MRRWIGLGYLAVAAAAVPASAGGPPDPSTFSIVAADPEAGEVGVAVASRFFAVGSVVPWARADVGAVATQSFANTSFGPRGLDLLERGLRPGETLDVLLRQDAGRDQRQVGVVSAAGDSATYTGTGCQAWAGGRHGPGYAAQGNILVGEAVVVAMENRFLETAGRPLAERLFEALRAGDAAGGDARGRQSAAVLVARAGAGYGGFTDRAVDVRVDDHPDPFSEMERLVRLAVVNDDWNRGWTAFKSGAFSEALKWQERTAEGARNAAPGMLPEVLYDLAVIRLAAGDADAALAALADAVAANPKLAGQARSDPDLAALADRLDAVLEPDAVP